MGAWAFLCDLVSGLSRAQLAVVAVAHAFVVVVCVAIGTAFLSGWPAVGATFGLLSLVTGSMWAVLGSERVQQWIRHGW